MIENADFWKVILVPLGQKYWKGRGRWAKRGREAGGIGVNEVWIRWAALERNPVNAVNAWDSEVGSLK